MGTVEVPVRHGELSGRISWFITLRWLAIAGLVAAVTAGRFLLAIPLPLAPLYLGAGALSLYNAGVQVAERRLRSRGDRRDWQARAYRLARLQVFVDLSLLTYLLFFSGGLENPFAYYYIFHMILSGILLSRRSAYLVGCFAVLLFMLLMAGHRLGWIASLSPPGYAPFTAAGIAAMLGRLAAFASTVYIVVYLTTTIVAELRQREQELEVSNGKLAEQDRLKSRYVLTVSHDLQATLSAIHALLSAVLEGYAGRIAGRARELVGRATARTEELLRFVRDLLDVSRIRAEAELTKHSVALPELVRAQVELFRTALEEKRLALDLELAPGDLRLWANPLGVEQLVNNLLSNAIRYTPAGGKITVSAGIGDRGNRVELRVADTGIGIPPESLPHIFEDFYRAGNARCLTDSGTGLGLPIVKRIAEAHGGEVRVESEVGKGSTFVVCLPAPPGTLDGGCPEQDARA